MLKRIVAFYLCIAVPLSPYAFAQQKESSAMLQPFGYYNDIILQQNKNSTVLDKRDSSLVAAAVAIARNQGSVQERVFIEALQNGISADELGEIIAHLGFYSGWGNAETAAYHAEQVLFRLNLRQSEHSNGKTGLLPLDQAAEKLRTETVEKTVGSSVFPSLVANTTDVLFHDLWLRPGLSARDRSLITVCALIANGQSAQLGFHLNKAMDNGLTRAEAAEVLAQTAFYAGWPNAFSAVPAIKAVFESREPGR